MNITVSESAVNWFKAEIELTKDQGIRFFGKIYGKTQVHDGFSIGMTVDTPENVLAQEIIAELTFFIEETDEWFFKGYDLFVDYDEQLFEPSYAFIATKS
ncbi:MAG: HesB/YadR/YfhF family protein [Enterococcus sp.]